MRNLKKINEQEFLKMLKTSKTTMVPLDPFQGMRVSINWECSKHHIQTKNTPRNIICRNQGCPQCKGEKEHNSQILTNKIYLKRLKEKQIARVPLEEYKGMDIPLQTYCPICNTTFLQRPRSTLKNHCPNYRYVKTAESQTWSNEKFLQELEKVHHKNIIAKEEYKKYNKKMLFHCNECNSDFTRTPNEILSGYGCNQCHRSKGELLIKAYLDENQIPYEQQKKFEECKNVKKLPFDFYLPELNICIEFDGNQHYDKDTYQRITGCSKGILDEEFNKLQQRDQVKTNFCNSQNIKLIRITEQDQKNIPNILKGGGVE